MKSIVCCMLMVIIAAASYGDYYLPNDVEVYLGNQGKKCMFDVECGVNCRCVKGEYQVYGVCVCDLGFD